MSKGKINQLKVGSMLSYVQMMLNVVIGLIYTPVMIRLLGQSEYGLYQTVISTISMLSVLNLGFNAGYIRYYARYRVEDDQDGINKLNGLFLLIFLGIGSVAFLCGTYLNLNLNLVFSNGLTAEEYQIVHVLMALLTFNLALSFPMSVFQNIISANEQFVFLKLINMIKTVFSPFLTLPLLLMGYRSIALVSVTVALSMVADVLFVYYVLFVLKNRFVFSGFKWSIVKELLVYTSFIAINAVVDQINLNIDKMLLARFKGTAQVSIYSVGYAMYSYYQLMSTSVSNVFTPRIHKIVNCTWDSIEQQRSQLTELFVRVGRIQFMILGLVLTGFILFGSAFIVDIWATPDYGNSYYVALLLMCPATIALTQNLGIEIQRALNRHQFRSIVYLIMALVNLTLSIYLCQIYGAVGSAVGTAISLVLANGLIMNIFYEKRCNIDILLFWKNIGRLAVPMTIPVVSGFFYTRFVNIHRTFLLILGIVAYTLVYACTIWKLGMNPYEKRLIGEIYLRVRKKRGIPKY